MRSSSAASCCSAAARPTSSGGDASSWSGSSSSRSARCSAGSRGVTTSLIAFRALQGLGAATHHAGRPLDPRRDLRRGSRAQHRAGRLGRRGWLRRRGRRAARRDPHRLALVGVDLLRQRPGGRRGARPRAVPALGEPRQARPGLRRPRCGARHVRSRRLLVLGITQGHGVGLGLGRDDRRLRRLGALLLVAFVVLGAARRASARAVLDLPAADADGGERRRLHPRDGAVRDVPDADALHAAGARLLARSRRASATSRSPARRSSGRTSRRPPSRGSESSRRSFSGWR